MMNRKTGRAVWLMVALVLGFHWILAWAPAAAQGPVAPLLEKPQPTSEHPGPAEQGETTTTCGPLITDTCLPIEEHHASLQVLGSLSMYTANFSPNWRSVSVKGDQYTFSMPVKFTYGPAKNLETYIVVPFIYNWLNNVDRGAAGPNGERNAGYAGIGDITTVAKYNLLPEGEIRPAVTAVGGVGWPTGHASRLNPRFLGQDAVGTGSFNFITGVNLYKWVKPFLFYSNIWLNSPVNLYRLRGNNFPQNVRNRENVTFNLAAEYPLNKQWILLLEMYSNWSWSNSAPESLGYQSPAPILGFLPGIEYFATEKWAFAAGVAFDALGKFASSRTIVPTFSVYYNF
ncbi:MAG: transporter [Deltaproteobacteria bacterium]|nr:transporter [Deltaproteobacteria bacterium]